MRCTVCGDLLRGRWGVRCFTCHPPPDPHGHGKPKTGQMVHCEVCGTEVYAKLHELVRGRRRFCSRRCKGAAETAEYERTWRDRFWSRVRKTDGCWEWLGPGDGRGHYGFASIRGKTTLAHRVAWEIVYGPIPARLQVRHAVCDNPICVKVTGDLEQDHLRLGTARENSGDMVAHGRAARGEHTGAYTKPHRVRRGEAHGRARLTESKVIAIRAAHAQGAAIQDLATEYGVGYTNVWGIVRRKSWRHI